MFISEALATPRKKAIDPHRGHDHGHRKNFFQGRHWGFFQNFSRGTKSGEICFFSLKAKKATIFAENFKIQGSLGPLAPPSYTHGRDNQVKNHCYRHMFPNRRRNLELQKIYFYISEMDERSVNTSSTWYQIQRRGCFWQWHSERLKTWPNQCRRLVLWWLNQKLYPMRCKKNVLLTLSLLMTAQILRSHRMCFPKSKVSI